MVMVKKLLVLGASTVFLANCGGTGQGEGSVLSSEFNSNIQGVALDGYLAGSTCYLDFNRNFERDSVEPFAKTDIDGYYSFNPNTNKNYCADDASEDDLTHCLRTNASFSNVPIRCAGGYDVISEEPFEGTLSTLTSITAGIDVENTTVSPLTTLLANAGSDTAKRQKVVDALLGVGVGSESDLAVDYIKERESRLTKLALKVQKVAEVLAKPITTIHEDDDVKVDAISQVYAALTDHIADTSETDIDNIFNDTDKLTILAQSAESKFVAVKKNKKKDSDDDSAGSGATVAQENRNKSAERAKQIHDVTESLCGKTGTGSDEFDDEMKGCARATEVVVQKTKSELENDTIILDSSIDTAVTCLTSGNCTSVVDALKGDNFDIGTTKKSDFSNPADTAVSAALPEDAEKLSVLGGKSLLVNDPDNSDASKKKHARLELYFGEGETATKGPLTACIRYIEGVAANNPNASDDSDLESGDTRGTYVTGNWETVGTSGFSVLLRLKITENSTPYEAVMKSAGSDSSSIKVFRFDFNGGLDDWKSVNGIVAVPDNKPTTNATCRERFNNVTDSI